jgi:hypothetical protein
VVKALDYFRAERLQHLDSLENLEEVFSRYPDDKAGNTELAVYLWGYKLWTRAALLRRLAAHFRSIGVTNLEELSTWAAQSNFHSDFEGKVRFKADGRTYGLGFAIYNWLVMRLGVETVKPDVHVHAFVRSALGRKLSDSDAVSAVVATADALGMPIHELDWRIWEAGRGMSAEAAHLE